MSLHSFKEHYLEEAAAETVTLNWGRFNPPTIGHEKLLDISMSKGSGVHRVYATQSQDNKKNPLDWKTKIKYMRKVFPKHARHILMDKRAKTIFDVLNSNSNSKFEIRNSKFEINTLPGGKFGLKLTRPKPTLMKISARNINESGNYTSEFQGGARKSARKLVRGENSISNFNNIPILNTPIKRKIDVNEVSICPGSPCANLPGQQISSESPAKRRKWGR